ncbi:MAG: glycosyltransferase family 2 protein [Chloroflexi bacterium]|nr:glycosyltransferase family 2 protein [Chloroflexota bacterium]
MTTFSVIITTHNRPRWLTECLDSILAQWHPPDEVIVVDDGSRTSTHRALHPYLRSHWITHLRQQQQGWGAARLNGARLATGEVLVFLDDDCIAPSHWLSAYANAYAAHPDADGIAGSLAPAARQNLAGAKQYRGHIAYFETMNTQWNSRFGHAGQVWFSFGGNRSFRRAVWLGAQSDSTTWYADDTTIDMTLREQGRVIYYEPAAWVCHRYYLTLEHRLRAAYRYGLSPASITSLLHPETPARGLLTRWSALRQEFPDFSWRAHLWYITTQPLIWAARHTGKWVSSQGRKR